MHEHVHINLHVLFTHREAVDQIAHNISTIFLFTQPINLFNQFVSRTDLFLS